jgi:hypothetical protein
MMESALPFALGIVALALTLAAVLVADKMMPRRGDGNGRVGRRPDCRARAVTGGGGSAGARVRRLVILRESPVPRRYRISEEDLIVMGMRGGDALRQGG